MNVPAPSPLVVGQVSVSVAANLYGLGHWSIARSLVMAVALSLLWTATMQMLAPAASREKPAGGP